MELLAIVFCFLLTFVLVPPVRSLAWRIGAVDIPQDWRRMHRDSVPRNGGMALFAAFAASALLFCRMTPILSGALAGGLLMLAVGLVDDTVSLPAWLKLFFQAVIATAALVCKCGIADRRLPIALLWILLLTNAHNLIDGLDGLLGGAACIESIALALLLATLGSGEQHLPPLLLAAACAGFLIYNRPPAVIFAGDCGSGSIGFLLGMLSLPLLLEPAWGIGYLSPLFIFAYPLTDLSTAILRRSLRGRWLFAADRAHLHHRICAMGLPTASCTAVLLLLSAALGGIGVLIGNAEHLYAAIAAIGITLALMIGLRRFLLAFAAENT